MIELESTAPEVLHALRELARTEGISDPDHPAVVEWADQAGLQVDWLRRMALEWTSADPRGGSRTYTAPDLPEGYPGERRPLSLTLPGWPLAALSWVEYRAWAEARFTDALTAHRDEMEEAAHAAGWSAEDRREREPDDPRREFRWLIRWQVRREAQQAIWEDESVPPSTFEGGLNRAFEKTGIERKRLRNRRR